MLIHPGRLTGGISLFLKLAIGFGIEAGVVVFVTTCLGAIATTAEEIP